LYAQMWQRQQARKEEPVGSPVALELE